jgi:acyl-CoA reductase-like NAD-dependent aldehyde dehydrogenase
VQAYDRIYVGGGWVPSAGTGTLEVIDSASEKTMGSIPDGTPADVDAAASAARTAFDAWSRTSVEDRAAMLDRIADGLAARADELAELIAREVGMPIKLAKQIQVGLPLNTFRNLATLVRQFPFEEQVGNSLLVREPAGVIGAITPWNYPLHQIAAKVAPALAAGCTVVLKPSEVAPLNAFVLAEIIDAAGLPAGAFNLVSGTGPVVGEAIVQHPQVDMISFTGSTRAGRRVQELAAQGVKRVALELGGKSPNVLLEDADLTKAVPDAITKAFLNSGQTCSALTRLVVPRGKLPEIEALATAAAERMAVGDPIGGGRVFLGPLVSDAQRERVRGYIRKGVEEGAKLLTGGDQPPEGLDVGYYVRPTVFSEVTPQMTIAQEEIFGPVLVIQPYDTEEDAVRIANDTVYGLAGGVWSADPERAKAVARRIRAGQVEVNGGAFNPNAPFGGYKQSGIGREYGRFGLEEFLEVKAMQL